MNKKLLSLFFCFTLTFLICISLFTFSVKADETYNWVLNAGFEECGGYDFYGAFIDGGFEGSNSSGKWFGTGNPAYAGGCNGSRCGYLSYPQYLEQNFTYNGLQVYTSELSLLSFYAYNDITDTSVRISGYLTNGTYYEFTKDVTHGAWRYIDCTSEMVALNGCIGTCRFTAHQQTLMIDTVRGLFVGSGQPTVSENTLPWFTAQDFLYQGINIAGVAHSGIACFYTGWGDQKDVLCQNFNFLDSNTVSSISLWAWTQDTNGIVVRFGIVYSDRTTSAKNSEVVYDTDGWKELTFSGFVLPNKLIIQIQISIVSGGELCYSHIDDVSVLSSVPQGQGIFSWKVTPTPISNTTFSFTQYEKISGVFTGYVYNGSGYLNQNGTFTVLCDFTGSQSVNIVNCIFNFPYTARSVVTDMTEYWYISVVVMNNTTVVRTFSVTLTVYWIDVDAGGDGIGNGYDSWYSNMIVSFMILFLLIFLPALILAFEFSKHGANPMVGFMCGITMMCIFGKLVNLIDLWVIFLVAIIDVIMMLELLHSRGTF